MSMKKMIAAMLCAGVSLMAMAQGHALIVTTRSAGNVAYALSTKPVVTFMATDVVLTTDEVTVVYPLSDHVSLTFAADMTGIGEAKDIKASVSISGGNVCVRGVEPGAAVEVLTIDGRIEQSVKADESGKATVTLEGKGIRMIKTGKVAFKILTND